MTDNRATMRQPDGIADLIFLVHRCRARAAGTPHGDAIAIAGGRVMLIDRRARVLRWRGRRTQVVELPQAVITPGLVDCHTHFFYWALHRALGIDVSALRSLDAVLHRIRAQARTRHVGDWVLARGFDPNLWTRGLPSARDLDRIVPDRPVIVRSHDGHTAWLNTAALRRAGITARTDDPPGGRIVRDARGRPTGILHESALESLPDPLRELARRSDAEVERSIEQALSSAYRVAWEHGLVGVHSMEDGTSLSHLMRHRLEGRLGLRVLHAVARQDLPKAVELGLRSGWGDEWLRLGGVKVFADGALGSQTAYMFDSYPGRRGHHGVPVTAGRELVEIVRAATRQGWAVWIHAIGDRAVHEAIIAIAAARRFGRPALPHRIEHAQCVRPADVRRMARLGIVASVQPCHLPGDIPIADRHWPRARRHAYPFRRLLAAGVTLAAGSDVPIEPLDPRGSLFGAVARTDPHGSPAGGWFPAQRLTTAEVLHAFTRGAALAAGTTDATAGVLTRGAPADMTIWADDPLRVGPQTLREIGILGCVVGGRVHLRDDGGPS